MSVEQVQQPDVQQPNFHQPEVPQITTVSQADEKPLSEVPKDHPLSHKNKSFD